MKLTLQRIAKKSTYTVGKLYIDGSYFCDTIEDTDRGLTDAMSEEDIAAKKIKNLTAIPTGVYTVSLNIVSPKYSKAAFYQENANGGRVPRLLNVKGYDGILIHAGNTAADTSGCILVGRNTVKGAVTASRQTFKELYPRLQAAAEGITIEIK